MRRNNKDSSEAECRLLARMVREPDLVFDIDGNYLDDKDFSRSSSRCIYSAIRDLAGKNNKIESLVLEERVATLFPKHYNKCSGQFHRKIRTLFKIKPASDIAQHVNIILSSAIKNRAINKLNSVTKSVSEMRDHAEILSFMEGSFAEFMTKQLRTPEIINLGQTYDEYILQKEKMLLEGRHVGIRSGFNYYDQAIGGGLRPGAVDVLVARAKTGKSLCAINLAYNVVMQGIPVLYLDTEMTKDQQMTRLLSVDTGVPMYYLDHGKFLQKEKYKKAIADHKDVFMDMSLDYVEVCGWKLHRQTSLIRSWFARKVGRDEQGNSKPALIVLDYLKLMDPSDRGYDTKEHEALGYYMSSLKDVVKQLRIPMFTMGQQNRLGIDEGHEGTVAGSDRISWFCDSLSVIFPKRVEDLQAEYDDEQRDETEHPSNLKMKVLLGRHGAGSRGFDTITLYSDVKNPVMSEKKMTAKIVERGQEKILPRARRRQADD